MLTRLPVFFALFLVSIALLDGCSKSSSSTTSLGGPIGGTYLITNAYCNGVAATGSNAVPTSPDQYLFTFDTSTFTATLETTGGCTITVSYSASYGSNSTVSMTSPSTPQCSSSCDPTVCSGLTVNTYPAMTYLKTGSTLTLTAGAGDTRCSTATPAQTDPLSLVGTQQ